jgi:hypothetical protein
MIIKCLTVEAAGGGDIRNADLVKAFLAAQFFQGCGNGVFRDIGIRQISVPPFPFIVSSIRRPPYLCKRKTFSHNIFHHLNIILLI